MIFAQPYSWRVVFQFFSCKQVNTDVLFEQYRTAVRQGEDLRVLWGGSTMHQLNTDLSLEHYFSSGVDSSVKIRYFTRYFYFAESDLIVDVHLYRLMWSFCIPCHFTLLWHFQLVEFYIIIKILLIVSDFNKCTINVFNWQLKALQNIA